MVDAEIGALHSLHRWRRPRPRRHIMVTAIQSNYIRSTDRCISIMHVIPTVRGRTSWHTLCARRGFERMYTDKRQLQVQDISGGCGSMYAIEIESPKFVGLTVMKQHKLVNRVLKEEIAQWHGVQLRTKAA